MAIISLIDVQKPGAQDSLDSDVARWRSAVAGVLAKSTRRDAADLPAEPERLLDSPTYEGFPIRPLYTSLDALPEPALPGQWPYVRGGDALRDVRITSSVPGMADLVRRTRAAPPDTGGVGDASATWSTAFRGPARVLRGRRCKPGPG